MEGQSLRFTTISPSSNSVVITTGTGRGYTNIGSSTVTASGGNKKKSIYGLARRSASEVSSSNKLIFEVTHVSSMTGDYYTCTKLQIKDVKVSLTSLLPLTPSSFIDSSSSTSHWAVFSALGEHQCYHRRSKASRRFQHTGKSASKYYWSWVGGLYREAVYSVEC